MLTLVIGGSGSGKSEYAENEIVRLGRRRRIYVATMKPWDEECVRRIERHRMMRESKAFETIERYEDLEGLDIGAPAVNVRVNAGAGSEGEALGTCPPENLKTAVLLECLSNLVSNEMFGPNRMAVEREQWDRLVIRRVVQGVCHMNAQADDVIVVTNEVFSDGMDYDEWTERYRRVLGAVNIRLAQTAGRVVEVAAGIPAEIRGLD